MTPKAQANKEDKLNFIKIKKVLYFKGYHKERTRPTEWNNMFAPHISDRDLYLQHIRTLKTKS